MLGKSSYHRASLVAIAATCLCATSAFAQVVDKTTMNGKIMPGYQGWFFCPGDGNDPAVGWRHWSKDTQTIGPNLYSVDLWPDVAEYPTVFNAPGVTLTFGGTAQLYSAITPSTVNKHFEWMKNAGIDGVYLQRFLSETFDEGLFFQMRNTILQNVSAGANAHGRTWALEYDISGSAESTLYNELTQDWIYLSNTYNIRNDPRYLYHNGKPVIVIWGLGYQDRPGTPAITNQIINFFKNDPTYGGCYCVGGVPPFWRTLQPPAKSDPAWAATYRSWNCINPWTVGAYNNASQITSWKNTHAVPDVTECNNLGIKYLPTAWPGFSWDNLFNLPPGTSNIDRRNGQHLWDQAFAYLGLSGVNTLFVANFDECDEGTAIFKISDNVPTTNHWVGNNGFPPDWHMRLAGAAGQMARGEIPLSGTIPISPTGSNCLSGDVSINLGTTNVADGMTLVSVSDGDTQPGTIGGRDARRNVNSAEDFYFYFGVDDAFMFNASCGDVWVKVDYYDAGGGSIMFQYDAVSSNYKSGPSVTVGNTNTWKTTTFHVTDAYFGNRQNGGADFRLFLGTNVVRHIDVVRVAEKGPVSIFTATPTSGSAPLNVSFNGTASYDPNGSITSYAWIFGDGGTGTGSTINHSYAAGNYTARLTVTDNNGNTDFTTIPISVTGGVTQGPFGGTARAIPGVIQAEDYDLGGEDVAYNDTAVGNNGGAYRTDNVDIEATTDTGGGYNVGWTGAGEWLEHTVNVNTTGDYAIKLRVASGGSGGTVSWSVDGSNIATGKSFAGTGGWQTWTTIIVPGIFLSSGNNKILRLTVDAGDPNVNSVEFTLGGADVVSVDLASTNVLDGMDHPQPSDGDTVAATIGGHNCRKNSVPASDFYMYFSVTDIYALNGNKQSATITLDYYDTGTQSFNLQYDGTPGAYTQGATVALTNTNTWKTAVFNVSNAYFGNRQNNGSDFRIAAPAGVTYYIDTVMVFAAAGGPVTLNNSAFPSNADGWNIVVWHTGPNLDGTMVWQSANGNPTGNMLSNGSGGTNNTDSCTREGGEINKAVSTSGYNTLVQVVYDVRFETNQTGPTCIGSCPVLEGTCADKLAVYYSTAGTAGPWTLLEAVDASSVTQNVWSTRTINCPAAANNKPNFAVRFRWQFNTSTDGGRLDNVKVIATP